MKEFIVETKRSSNYLISNEKTSSIPTLFLHGFAGTSDSWLEIITMADFHAIAPDIVGHGKSKFIDLSDSYGIDEWCEDFSEVLDSMNIKKINLCGYSMGGRMAIAFASKNKKLINSLILESASTGIDDKNLRNRRKQKELELCSEIDKDLYEFVQNWEDNPLFANQRERNEIGFLSQRDSRLSHDPQHLVKALKSFGQGEIRSYADEFSIFSFPIVLINGEEDQKYTDIARLMKKINEGIAQYEIPNCGHNAHLENPTEFYDYLTSISDTNDICKVCLDVIIYCKCHERILI